MNKSTLSILLLSGALPLAASAQTTAPAPGASDPSTNQTQELETNQNNAHGGMNDARPLQQSADAGASSQGAFVTVPQSGAWRVSDLEGKAVYGADGQNIGSIGDVLVSQDGSVNAVIIGVGGFLGLGQKDVAVDMSVLQLGPGATQEQAVAASQANPGISGETTASTQADPAATQEQGSYGTTGGQGTTAMGGVQGTTTTGTGMPAANSQMAANGPNAVRIGEDGLPDRIILNVTRDQLEDAPEFEGVLAEQR